MFLAALALAVHLVQPGDTLSSIAAQNGVSLSALEAANPQFSGNYDLIFAGQEYNLPGGGTSSQAPDSISGDHNHASSLAPVYHTAQQSKGSTAGNGNGGYSTGGSSSGGGSGSLSSIPGVPSSFAKCVAWHESGNGSNQAYNGGVYGIIRASGYNVNGQSISAQKAAFSKLYAQYGTKPWAGDGCA